MAVEILKCMKHIRNIIWKKKNKCEENQKLYKSNTPKKRIQWISEKCKKVQEIAFFYYIPTQITEI